MRKALLSVSLILGLLFCEKSMAQVSWIVKLYKYAHTRDTTFYTSKPGDFDVKIMENMLGTVMSTHGSEGDASMRNFKSRITSENMINSSINVGYKGIALGYTFDPFGDKSGDTRFMLSLYGNFLGIDFLYNKIKSFSGYSEFSGIRYDIPYGVPEMKIFNINSYIVFNHKHFSYPSGVCQSYIQKRSSGSLIGGVTFSRNRTNVADMGFGVPDLNIDSRLVAVGAGYAYTYVPAKDIQISLMLMPKFVVYNSSWLNLAGKRDVWSIFKRAEMTHSYSFAAVKWFKKFYCAITALGDSYSQGSPLMDFSVLQIHWHFHAHLGINF